MTNSAFEYLRTFKQVSPETETLVMRTVKYRFPDTSISELQTIFERGVMGDYGKFIVADPQTILGWVKEYKNKNVTSNYLESGLLNPDEDIKSQNYHPDVDGWMKESNKAYLAFLGGTKETYFHPHVYDRMMCDKKIEFNAYMKYYQDNGNLWQDVKAAKQKILRDTFLTYKSNGYNTVYFIKPK